MIPQVSRVKAAVPSSLTQINGVVKLCVACDVLCPPLHISSAQEL